MGKGTRAATRSWDLSRPKPPPLVPTSGRSSTSASAPTSIGSTMGQRCSTTFSTKASVAASRNSWCECQSTTPWRTSSKPVASRRTRRSTPCSVRQLRRGGRPHTLGLMAARQLADLWPALVQRSLAHVAEHQPGPIWCSLRHYDEAGIRLLQVEGFEVIASEMLMVRELPLKVPARIRVRIKDKRLVPQYG